MADVNKRLLWIAVGVGTALVLACAILWISPAETGGRTGLSAPQNKRARVAAAPPVAASTPEALPVAPVPSQSPAAARRARVPGALDAILAALRRGTPEANKAALEQLRRLLESVPPSEAIAAIRAFLESGRDAHTGLHYTIGAGGRLDQAPTLRTFLLDELGSLARAGGDARESLAMARAILGTPGSPDEWSLAMRNVGWEDKASGPYLNGKFRELLGQRQWLADPSPGLLEAFDVPVFTHDVQSIALLSEMLPSHFSGDAASAPVNRAAAVALDRLAERAPLDVMRYLNENPTVLADSPMFRADYFSKANVSDPAQRAALEAYLGRTDVTDAERNKVVQGLASPGSFVAETLLTGSPQPVDPAVQLGALAQLARDWAVRFPELSRLLQRLVAQEQAN